MQKYNGKNGINNYCLYKIKIMFNTECDYTYFKIILCLNRYLSGKISCHALRGRNHSIYAISKKNSIAMVVWTKRAIMHFLFKRYFISSHRHLNTSFFLGLITKPETVLVSIIINNITLSSNENHMSAQCLLRYPVFYSVFILSVTTVLP